MLMMVFALGAECQVLANHKGADGAKTGLDKKGWAKVVEDGTMLNGKGETLEKVFPGNRKNIGPNALRTVYLIEGEGLFYTYPSSVKECYVKNSYVRSCRVGKIYNKDWLKTLGR